MTQENQIFKPILFSTLMVQAILEGRKTQTRRVMDPQPGNDVKYLGIAGMHREQKYARFRNFEGLIHTPIIDIKQKIEIGDILWVRETWRRNYIPTGCPFEYKATAEKDGTPLNEPWKPSIFMPKEAARIFLRVTNFRVERLEDITKEDAIAEGIESWKQQGMTRYKSYVGPMVGFWDDDSHLQTGGVHAAIASFRSLWMKINGQESLNSNPWLFVYDFEQIDKPEDFLQ